MNSNNMLAVKIFENFKDDNIFFSPYSIYIALLMVLEGAEEDIKNQCTKEAGFELTKEYSKLSVKKAMWEVANSLWYGAQVNPEYINTLMNIYGAEVFDEIDVNRINSWVSGKTHGKIKDIIENLDPLELAVLVNAVYFKGKWLNQFKVKNTSKQNFNNIDGTQTNIDMMYLSDTKFSYFFDEDKNVQSIKIPYIGEDISMVIAMPLKEIEVKKGEALIQSSYNVSLNEFHVDLSPNNKTVVNITGPKDVKTLKNYEKQGLIKILKMNHKNIGVKENPNLT